MEQEMQLRHNTLGDVEGAMGKIWKSSSWVKQIEKKVKWQRSGSTVIFHHITNSPFDQGLEHINRTMKVSVVLVAITLNEHSFSFFHLHFFLTDIFNFEPNCFWLYPSENIMQSRLN